MNPINQALNHPRYRELAFIFKKMQIRPFSALREKFREGYSFADLRADILSGAVVGLVAIPLGMALAIASGVAPQYGVYTVIVGGGLVALLGGSRFQVTGPTAAFVVILVPIVHKFGFSGLLLAGFFAGLMLVAFGLLRMGKLIQYIPHPVTTGFTAGIGVVIATIQLKDLFGLRIETMPEHFLDRVAAMLRALPTTSIAELSVGMLTLGLLLIWPRVNKKIPAPLIALSVVTVLTVVLHKVFPFFEIATIGSRFPGGIPQVLPTPDFPWNFVGPDGKPFVLSLAMVQAILPSAFAIAMLGAIESLLSAVVADGMAATRHDPDAELVALGAGNIVCPFFGGIAATGAIARTATNIRFGARSPLSAIFHAVFVLLAVLLFAPQLSYLPMASMAALLVLVAYNMSDVKHFVHVLRVAPPSDVAVLLICFFLTVVFDMVIGVTVGVMLAALLFMRRMASITSSQTILGGSTHELISEPLPEAVVLYQIAGPLFFGAAEKAVAAMGGITDDVRVVIFYMDEVPTMDVTGLVALESAIEKLNEHGKLAILAEVRTQPRALLVRSRLLEDPAKARMCDSLQQAITEAKKFCALSPLGA
ncbi:MAG: C4-dicarboxylic acid transporter DauA [Oligoflexia bacterium]|nr:C4-dicarboxylic acid transporter DauA [Oligoflexia bacterium]